MQLAKNVCFHCQCNLCEVCEVCERMVCPMCVSADSPALGHVLCLTCTEMISSDSDIFGDS